LRAEPIQFSYVIRPAGASVREAARVRLPVTPMPLVYRPEQTGLLGVSNMSVTGRCRVVTGDEDLGDYAEAGKFKPVLFLTGGVVRAHAIERGYLPSAELLMEFPPLPGLPANPSMWRVVYADSVNAGDGDAEHAVDGSPETHWHTQWSDAKPPHPHEIVIDMGESLRLIGFTLLPRQDMTNGRIRHYGFYLSADGKSWGDPVIADEFTNSPQLQTVLFPAPAEGRFLRLVAKDEWSGRPYTTIAEIRGLVQSQP
jgi:beta-galactosidase